MKRNALYISIAFALVGGYYLITEHRAHLLDYLPFILLMACPLIHLFHGRGHGHEGHAPHREKKGAS